MFEWDGSDWVQVGDDIEALIRSAAISAPVLISQVMGPGSLLALQGPTQVTMQTGTARSRSLNGMTFPGASGSEYFWG